MDNLSILPILKKIPLFTELNEEDHSEIIKKIRLEYYPPDHQLFGQGGLGDCLYIIKKGAVKIFHPANEETPVALLGPNDFFGEMALVEDKPRSASATTRDECEIFILEKTDFYDLILKNQAMASRISEEFLDRIQENQRKANEPLT
jgi:CRP-like cAMP-binding protein